MAGATEYLPAVDSGSCDAGSCDNGGCDAVYCGGSSFDDGYCGYCGGSHAAMVRVVVVLLGGLWFGGGG